MVSWTSRGKGGRFASSDATDGVSLDGTDSKNVAERIKRGNPRTPAAAFWPQAESAEVSTTSVGNGNLLRAGGAAHLRNLRIEGWTRPQWDIRSTPQWGRSIRP